MPDFTRTLGQDDWIQKIQANVNARTTLQTIATANGMTIDQAIRCFVHYVWPDVSFIPTAITRAQAPLHASWTDFRDKFLAGNTDNLDITKWFT